MDKGQNAITSTKKNALSECGTGLMNKITQLSNHSTAPTKVNALPKSQVVPMWVRQSGRNYMIVKSFRVLTEIDALPEWSKRVFPV
jgi:hypothetical protein